MEKSESLIDLEDHDELEIEFMVKGCKTADQLRRRQSLLKQFDELLAGQEPGEDE